MLLADYAFRASAKKLSALYAEMMTENFIQCPLFLFHVVPWSQKDSKINTTLFFYLFIKSSFAERFIILKALKGDIP